MSVVKGGGGGVQPKFSGKVIFEIGVGQQAPPIGATFGGVSGVTRPSGRGLRACPYMGAAEVIFIFGPKP